MFCSDTTQPRCFIQLDAQATPKLRILRKHLKITLLSSVYVKPFTPSNVSKNTNALLIWAPFKYVAHPSGQCKHLHQLLWNAKCRYNVYRLNCWIKCPFCVHSVKVNSQLLVAKCLPFLARFAWSLHVSVVWTLRGPVPPSWPMGLQ